GIPFRDFGHDIGECRTALRLLAGTRVGSRNVHPGLGSKLLHRVHEWHAAMVGEEADRVSMGPAPEAMVKTLVVVDREARRLLVVEGTARFELASRTYELH